MNLNLIALYAFQGIITLFFTYSMQLMMVSKGYTMLQVSMYSVVSYAFSTKIFFSPFVNIFYSKSFGKAKSYIIPINIIVSFILLYLSITDVFENLAQTSVLAFIACWLMGIQDLALDGLQIQYANDNPALMQNIGINIGNSIALLYNMISSYVTPEEFMTINAFIWVPVTALLFFSIQEQELKSKVSFAETKTVFLSLIRNTNIIGLIGLLFFETFPMSVLDNCYQYRIIQAGMSKEAISVINTFMLPFKLLTAVLFTKFFSKYNNFKYYANILPLRLTEVLSLLAVYWFEMHYIELFYLYFLVYLCEILWYVNYNTLYIIRGNFYCSITTPGFESTTMTVISTFSQFGLRFSTSVAFYLSNYFSFYTLTISGLVLQLVYSQFFKKKYQRYALLPKKEWLLTPGKE